MKFCKNLQRVADLSNPEWSPYWTDYKKLKKIIKRLSDLELAGNTAQQNTGQEVPATCFSSSSKSRGNTCGDSQHFSDSPRVEQTRRHQGQGDRTAEMSPGSNRDAVPSRCRSSQHVDIQTSSPQQPPPMERGSRPQSNIETIKKNPGEVLFFKLLHAEFQKAVHFFDRVIDEFHIREERVLDGMQIVKRENRFHLWNMLAKSVYRFYTDLLLLETFCIMTYCSFSKILKKHDKVTGFDTRNAFMSNVVNKANFTNYTNLQEMISRCEQLYSEVSNRIVEEGRQDLYEDERLFIEMVHQLNQQV